MKMIYVVQGTLTGCNGDIIHWADSAYFDEKEAHYRCNEMNRSAKKMTQIIWHMLLDQYHSIKKLRTSETRCPIFIGKEKDVYVKHDNC